MPEFNLAGRWVGPNHPPLVIAEIGINHEGRLETAFEMVDAAAGAGAEVVKHQTHVIDDEMSGAAKKVIPGNAKESIYDIMSRCALSERDERRLKDYVESKGMIFLSTPFSRAAADRLERMQVAAYKIGSGECNNYPLIKHIAGFGKPIILSTGMNTIETVAPAVEIFETCKIPYALLHTTNLYPTPPHLARGCWFVGPYDQQSCVLGCHSPRRLHFGAALYGYDGPPGARHRLFDGPQAMS